MSSQVETDALMHAPFGHLIGIETGHAATSPHWLALVTHVPSGQMVLVAFGQVLLPWLIETEKSTGLDWSAYCL